MCVAVSAALVIGYLMEITRQSFTFVHSFVIVIIIIIIVVVVIIIIIVVVIVIIVVVVM